MIGSPVISVNNGTSGNYYSYDMIASEINKNIQSYLVNKLPDAKKSFTKLLSLS